MRVSENDSEPKQWQDIDTLIADEENENEDLPKADSEAYAMSWIRKVDTKPSITGPSYVHCQHDVVGEGAEQRQRSA
jgi:hypothetical protein